MEITELSATIESGIGVRGAYFLMDESQLDLIGGPGTLQKLYDDPDVMQRVATFAHTHGWYVAPDRRGLVFLSKTP
jgi:hypothetical protein